jgi:hypothetical protein
LECILRALHQQLTTTAASAACSAAAAAAAAAGKKRGKAVLMPFQMAVLVGITITYTVVGGDNLHAFAAGLSGTNTTIVPKWGFYLMFGGLQVLLSMVSVFAIWLCTGGSSSSSSSSVVCQYSRQLQLHQSTAAAICSAPRKALHLQVKTC